MRSHRCIIPAHPHHVVLQSVAARKLFSYPADYLRFLRYLAEASARNACRLHGFALLAGRADLLMSPRTALDLSNCIQVTCQRYALVRNKIAKQTGSIFAPRYVSSLVEVANIAEARATIERQPMTAGKTMRPEAYRWSSANPRLAAAFCPGSDKKVAV